MLSVGLCMSVSLVWLSLLLAGLCALANNEVRLASKQNQKFRWEPPQRGQLKINFDGSVINSDAAADFVIRNEEGLPIVAGARSVGENSNSLAEALALRDAFGLVKGKGSRKFVGCDSKLVVDAIKGFCETPWRLRNIIEDIKWLDRTLPSVGRKGFMFDCIKTRCDH
ncbi:hypothetical protein ACFX1S_026713 [Malus domestica]